MARAGLFRDRVTFERMASTTDDFGNVSGSWSTLASRYGHMIERTGKEETTQGALMDVSTATLRVRADSTTEAVHEADRVIARGKTWAIRSIIQVDAKGDILEMLIEKGVAS